MLKSFEALYHKGHLHWIGASPPEEIERRRVVVVIDLEKRPVQSGVKLRMLLSRTRACLEPLRSIQEIDNELAKTRTEWDREWEK